MSETKQNEVERIRERFKHALNGEPTPVGNPQVPDSGIAKQRVGESLEQYREGAITYVEFVRFAWSQVTEQDVEDHNQYGGLCDEMRADWPFAG